MTSRAERLADLRRDVPQEDLDLIDEYLDNAAMENKTNQITPGRRLNETRDLLELREEIGEAAWRHGMSTANGALAPNINYVKKVAAKHDGGTRYDQPPAKKPKRYNPTGETITGWDHLDEVMKGD